MGCVPIAQLPQEDISETGSEQESAPAFSIENENGMLHLDFQTRTLPTIQNANFRLELEVVDMSAGFLIDNIICEVAQVSKTKTCLTRSGSEAFIAFTGDRAKISVEVPLGLAFSPGAVSCVLVNTTFILNQTKKMFTPPENPNIPPGIPIPYPNTGTSTKICN